MGIVATPQSLHNILLARMHDLPPGSEFYVIKKNAPPCPLAQDTTALPIIYSVPRGKKFSLQYASQAPFGGNIQLRNIAGHKPYVLFLEYTKMGESQLMLYEIKKKEPAEKKK